MSNAIKHCKNCNTTVMCHTERRCQMQAHGLSKSAGSRLVDLIEQWERRAKMADKLANDAAGAGEWTTQFRCKAKAGTIRSLTAELSRELQLENIEH